MNLFINLQELLSRPETLQRIGDGIIWGSITLYLLATVAYLVGGRGWTAGYWLFCACINFCVIMMGHQKQK